MNSESANSKRTADISLTWKDMPAPTGETVNPDTLEASKTAPETPSPAQEETAPASEKAEVKTEVKPEDTAPARKPGRSGVFVDTLLVLLLLGALGSGAWYTHRELEQYRVPTPMELAQAEHLELCKQHEQLQDAAYRADEQIRMRERIDSLNLQIADTRRQIAERKASIEDQHARVLALQQEIRQEDKTSRAVARNLLIGLPIGNAATTTGKAYPDAVIHRLEHGYITLRTPYGQSRFPLARLVKDNLPDIVRYAFGIDDMVDMSDFESAPRKKRQGKLITPRRPSTKVVEPSYEPETNAPVVNTQAQEPAGITVEPGSAPEESGTWDAPTAPLPIGE